MSSIELSSIKVEATGDVDGDKYDASLSLSDCFELLTRSPNVGLSMLMVASPNKMVAMLPAILLIAQLAITIAMGLSEYKKYDQGMCPATADGYTQIVMTCVAVLYFTETAMTAANAFTDGVKKVLDDNDVYVTGNNSIPNTRNLAQSGDWILSFVFEGIVTCLNLWLVFISTEPLDMVLNTVGLQFLSKIDDEFKAKLLNNFPVIIENLKHPNQDAYARVNPFLFNLLTCLSAIISALITISLPVICLVMMVYGPICKP